MEYISNAKLVTETYQNINQMKIFIFSKSCWNVYNFRKNLIKTLIKKNYQIYVLSNNDNYQKKLKSLG